VIELKRFDLEENSLLHHICQEIGLPLKAEEDFTYHYRCLYFSWEQKNDDSYHLKKTIQKWWQKNKKYYEN